MRLRTLTLKPGWDPRRLGQTQREELSVWLHDTFVRWGPSSTMRIDHAASGKVSWRLFY